MSKQRVLTYLVVLLVALPLAREAWASGFGLFDYGARGNALGGAMTAKADDPSALAFNPAGITQLDGLQLMGGLSVIAPSASVRTINPYTGAERVERNEETIGLPPHLYGTYKITDNLSAGLGIFSRFGLGSKFDDDWAGRYNSYDAELVTVSFNPNVAWKAADRLSLALGLEVMRVDLLYKKKIDGSLLLKAAGLLPPTYPSQNPDTTTFDIDQKIAGDSWGVGVNAGIRYQLNDQWAFGASYRSQIQQEIEGDAEFDKPAALSSPAFAAAFRDTGVRGKIVLPDVFAFGVEYKPLDNLSIEADATWTRWSTYKNLTINFDAEPVPGSGTVFSTPKDWCDTWRLALGVEYKPLDWLAARLGYIYDEDPAADNRVDYLTLGADRQIFSAGLGFAFGDFGVDASYSYGLAKDRDIPPRLSDGVFQTKIRDGEVHIVGLSMSYKF